MCSGLDCGIYHIEPNCNLMIDIQKYFEDSLCQDLDKRTLAQTVRIIQEDLFQNRKLIEDSPHNQHLLADLIQQISSGKPLAYITGKTYFYGYPFIVNEQVLIPRPETEELVEWILQDHPNNTSLRALDIGTGSGCIAITLALKRPNWHIQALDVSLPALQIANENAQLLGASLTFQEIDFLNEPVDLTKVNLIVSNPPYIQERERPLMDDSVLKYEPELALFPDDADPLIFYKRIAELTRSIKAPIQIYLEINEFLFEQTSQIFSGFDVQWRKDLQGKYRMIRVVYT